MKAKLSDQHIKDTSNEFIRHNKGAPCPDNLTPRQPAAIRDNLTPGKVARGDIHGIVECTQ